VIKKVKPLEVDRWRKRPASVPRLGERIELFSEGDGVWRETDEDETLEPSLTASSCRKHGATRGSAVGEDRPEAVVEDAPPSPAALSRYREEAACAATEDASASWLCSGHSGDQL
jgi:hypothetical protein